MKSFRQLPVFFALMLSGWGAPVHPAAEVPCSTPLAWRIGDVPATAELDKSRFRDKVIAAAERWNEAAGRSLLIHDEERGFPVHLSVDERQEEARELNEKYMRLADKRAELEDKSNRLEDERERQEALRAAHSADVAEYNRAMAAWNARVEAADGRLSRSERRELEAEQERLQAEREALGDREEALEQAAQDFSDQLDAYNQLATRSNALLMRINDRIPGAPTDAGEYNETIRFGADNQPQEISRDIRVNFYYNKTHLEVTLTHEFGHALGLEHVDVTNAVMFPSYTARADADSVRLHEADIEALRELCAD